MKIIEYLWILTYILYPIQNVSFFIKFLKPYYIVTSLNFLILALFFLKNSIPVNLLRFYLLFFVFLSWLFFSLFWSVNLGYSVYAFVKYSTYFLIGIFLSFSIYLAENYERFIFKILFACYLSAFFVSVAYLTYFFQSGGLNLFLGKISMYQIMVIASINVGFGGGRNLLASWLAFSLTLAFPILFYFFKENWKKILLVLSAVPITMVLLLTLSRTAQLALLVFIILLGIFSREFRGFSKKFLMSLFFVLVFILAVNPFNIGSFLIARFLFAFYAISGSGEDYGTEGRLELWDYAFKTIKDHFLLGSGIGTLYKGFPEIGGVENYHNIFIQMFAQVGFIGFILFTLWSIWLVYTSFRLRTPFSEKEKTFKVLIDIVFINILVYYFKSLLMFQYFDLEIWTLIGILGGLYILYENKKESLYGEK